MGVGAATKSKGRGRVTSSEEDQLLGGGGGAGGGGVAGRWAWSMNGGLQDGTGRQERIAHHAHGRRLHGQPATSSSSSMLWSLLLLLLS